MALSLFLEGGWSTDLALLFTNNYNIICMICLAIGLILCAIECFIPGFGIFGITGISFCLFSIVFMLAMGGTWRQFLFVIAIIIITVTLLILIAVRSARFGALSKSSLVQSDTSLPVNYSDTSKQMTKLLGKVGYTETVCKPVGKALIEGQTYLVITDGEFIEKEKKIYVSEVDGTSIIIKEK